LIDWLIDLFVCLCLIDLSIDRSIYLFIYLFIYLLIYWFIDWDWVVCFIDWLIDWLIDLFLCLFIHLFIDLSVDWRIVQTSSSGTWSMRWRPVILTSQSTRDFSTSSDVEVSPTSTTSSTVSSEPDNNISPRSWTPAEVRQMLGSNHKFEKSVPAMEAWPDVVVFWQIDQSGPPQIYGISIPQSRSFVNSGKRKIDWWIELRFYVLLYKE